MAYNYANTFVAQASKRIVAPAAERNKQPILDILLKHLPRDKPHRALEIASGTGQHVAHFAIALPMSQWQPTEASVDMLDSIQAYASELPNVHSPVALDVTKQPWPVEGPFDSVHATNITHIAPWPITCALLAGAASVLRPGGKLFLYGPFSIHGEPHTPGNLCFHQQLVATDPELGYRDRDTVKHEAQGVGLQLQEVIAMPADNFMMVFAASE